MGFFLAFCSIASVCIVVHALPPIEARHYIPRVGESCEFEGYAGVVTKTDDCPGAASIWQYGPQADVQCCIIASCNAQGDSGYGSYGSYTCLNTYKKDECGRGQGKFIPGHCLGDDTVQCCVDGPMDFSYEDSPGWRNNSPEDNSVIVPTLPNIGGEDSVIVPTLPTIDGEDAIVFPPIPTVNSEDGSIVVPTIPTANSEDDGIVVPTFNSPQTPPTTNPGGNWHKGGWANDIASAYSPTTEDYEYGSYDGDSGEWIV